MFGNFLVLLNSSITCRKKRGRKMCFWLEKYRAGIYENTKPVNRTTVSLFLILIPGSPGSLYFWKHTNSRTHCGLPRLRKHLSQQEWESTSNLYGVPGERNLYCGEVLKFSDKKE